MIVNGIDAQSYIQYDFDMKKIPAYSLMEMMVVIGLICLLMQLLKPTYDGLIKKARYVEILNAMGPVKLSVVLCYMQKGKLSSCSSGVNGVEPEQQRHTVRLIRSVSVHQGVIHVVPKDLYVFSGEDDLVLAPYVYAGGIRWKMRGGAIKKGWVQSKDD